jgi:hypothetical protein
MAMLCLIRASPKNPIWRPGILHDNRQHGPAALLGVLRSDTDLGADLSHFMQALPSLGHVRIGKPAAKRGDGDRVGTEEKAEVACMEME